MELILNWPNDRIHNICFFYTNSLNKLIEKVSQDKVESMQVAIKPLQRFIRKTVLIKFIWQTLKSIYQRDVKEKIPTLPVKKEKKNINYD